VSDNEPAAASVQVLRRFLERTPRRAAGEACDFCGEPIPAAHSHVVGVDTRRMSCACRACYLLFTHTGAAQGKYRAVPDRYLAAADAVFGTTDWDALQIPVGIAFFFFNSALGRTVVLYPSPAGATESMLALDAWDRVVAANPILATLQPDVEALLVRVPSPAAGTGVPGRPADCYIVPIDACYELVGRMRRAWRGFDGGDEARREVESFFVMVRRRCGLDVDAREASA
jgi:hypothetical protein